MRKRGIDSFAVTVQGGKDWQSLVTPSGTVVALKVTQSSSRSRTCTQPFCTPSSFGFGRVGGVGRFKARLSFQTLLSLLLLTAIAYFRQLIRLEDLREMEKHLDFDKKGSEQWVGDEKREETEYEDDTESEESCASTDGWKGKGREQVSFHFSHISSNALISAHAQRLRRIALLLSFSRRRGLTSPSLQHCPRCQLHQATKLSFR